MESTPSKELDMDETRAVLREVAEFSPVAEQDVPSLLTLIAPSSVEDNEESSVEVVARYTTEEPFDSLDLSNALLGDFRASIYYPRIEVTVWDGEVLPLEELELPEQCTELRIIWSPGQRVGLGPKVIETLQERVAGVLAQMPDAFTQHPIDNIDMLRSFAMCLWLKRVGPEDLGVRVKIDAPVEPRDLDVILKGLGLSWDDGAYRWFDGRDPSVDYFSVDVSDWFDALHFHFCPPRTPAPKAVLEQLLLAVETFQKHVPCTVTFVQDGESVTGPEPMFEALDVMIKAFEIKHMTPGSPEVRSVRSIA